ncbi:MAG: hypothetical protein U0840_19700 [Gemmataceae bacterium]
MKLTRFHLMGATLLLLAMVVSSAYTQFGGFGGGGRGGKGGGGFGGGGAFKMPSADDIFDRISGGAATFDVNKVELQQRGPETVEQQREKMMSYLQTKGVSNGQMTKELYREFFENRMKERSKDMAGKGFEMLSKGAESFDVSKVEISGMMLMAGSAESQREKMGAFLKSKGVNTGLMTRDLYVEYSENRFKEFREKGDTRTEEEKKKASEAFAKDAFTQMDTNKDGALTKEEAEEGRKKRIMGSSISEGDRFEKADLNKNGKIEMDEFEKYIQGRMDQRREEQKAEEKKPEEQSATKSVDLDVRPPVYRYGKLPRDLPGWFTDNDKDKDGQIGLYEWKQDGRDVNEFLTMDANGDGFLTPEEMLRHQRAQSGIKGTAVAASGEMNR